MNAPKRLKKGPTLCCWDAAPTQTSATPSSVDAQKTTKPVRTGIVKTPCVPATSTADRLSFKAIAKARATRSVVNTPNIHVALIATSNHTAPTKYIHASTTHTGGKSSVSDTHQQLMASPNNTVESGPSNTSTTDNQNMEVESFARKVNEFRRPVRRDHPLNICVQRTFPTIVSAQPRLTFWDHTL